MSRASSARCFGAILGGAAVIVATTSACLPFRAQKVWAYVRQSNAISISRPTVGSGETLIKIRNDRNEKVRLVLMRVDIPLADIPIRNGVVPVGKFGTAEYHGAGYRVIEKLDDLAPAFSPGQKTATLHVFLARGVYVLFSNRPGDFQRGIRAVVHVN